MSVVNLDPLPADPFDLLAGDPGDSVAPALRLRWWSLLFIGAGVGFLGWAAYLAL